MEASQVSPNLYGLTRVDSKEDIIERASASEPLSAGPPSAQHSTERLNTKEEWLPLAAADPAFWLKETNVSEERIARKMPYE